MSTTAQGAVRWLAVPIAGALAAAIVAAFVLSGGRTAGPEHVAFIASAPARVLDAGSARFSLARQFTDGADTVVIRQQGVADVRGRRARFTITVEPSGQPAQGPVTFMLDGTTVYLGLPESRSVGLTEGKRWLVTEMRDLSDAIATSAAPDPLAFLETLAGVGDRVRRVGREEVAGTPTTHYRLTATLQAAANRLSLKRQREVAPTIGQLGPEPLPVEAWIDGDGRPRRMDVRIDSSSSRTRITVEVDDYGAPVYLDLPDEGETFQVDTLQEALSLAGLA